MVSLSNLLPIVMILVVTVVGLSAGIDVNDDIRDGIGLKDCAARSDTFTSYNASSNLCYNSTGSTTTPVGASFNSSTDGLTGLANFSGKLPTIAVVIGAALLIGILVKNFQE